MVWKERQHEDDDSCDGVDAASISALQACGLLKFFQDPSMISHANLLEYILQMWNPEQQHFEVGAHILTMEVEDIYFLTRLSRSGAPISLTCSCGGDITTQ